MSKHNRDISAIHFLIGAISSLSLILSGCGNLPRLQARNERATPRPASAQQTRTVTPQKLSTAEPIPTATLLPVPTSDANIRSLMREKQADLFEEVWATVKESYIDPNLNGLDWEAERQHLLAQIKTGMSDEAFHSATANLVERLGDQHSYFLSPQDTQKQNQQAAGRYNYAGVGIIVSANLAKGYLYLEQVLPDSPAQAAGLKPHDHILTIDGTPSIIEGQRSDNRIVGKAGTDVTLSIRTPGQDARDVTITRAVVNAKEEVQARMLSASADKRIAYLFIPNLHERDIHHRVQKALADLMKSGNLDGLVIDMRVNGGGSYLTVKDILAMFTHGVVGGFADRTGVDEFDTFQVENTAVGNSQSVPLMVLMGPQTESFGEVFAGILQDQKRAKLIGLPSAGNIELLYPHDFNGGAELWLAEKRFVLPDGSSWERHGLTPDIPIDKHWDEYSVDNDPVLAAAVEALGK